MILRCELSENLEQKIENAALGEIIYALPYDVDAKGLFSKNYFIVTSENIISVSEEDIVNVFPVKRVEKVKATELVGAGRLDITVDGVCHVMAKYTAEYMPQFAMVERIVQEIIDGETKVHESFDESK